MKKYLFDLTLNTRDLGGYPTKDGHLVVYNRFIRSDSLDMLNEEGRDFLFKNNIRTQIDLRTDNVIINFPSELQKDERFNYYHYPLVEGSGIPLTDENASKLYLQMVGNHDTFKKIFTTIYEAKGGVIYNCTAGKDRTGMVTTLLLLLAGVSEENIIEDYMASNECIYSRIHLKMERSSTFPHSLGYCKREYIEEFLRLFKEKYRDVNNYLLTIGLTNEQIKTIKNRLVGE
jgi:protein-tyrosine phosphatase